VKQKIATELVVGDVICRDQYMAQILRGPYPQVDMFGRPMLGFWLRIVSGPDRVGEEGEHMYGSAGVAMVRSAAEAIPLQRHARNEIIQKFTELIFAFNRYVTEYPDAKELARLMGQGPALSEARYQFERATAPDEDP